MSEAPIPLQTDTLSPLPGGGVRTITATVLVGGVPTVVQMQVIALADSNGAVLEDWNKLVATPISQVLAELRKITSVLCRIAQIPDLASEDVSGEAPPG